MFLEAWPQASFSISSINSGAYALRFAKCLFFLGKYWIICNCETGECNSSTFGDYDEKIEHPSGLKMNTMTNM